MNTLRSTPLSKAAMAAFALLMTPITAAQCETTVIAGAPVPAPQGDGAATAGRFTMSPSGNGFVRLDTISGAVSLCARKGDGPMVCALADDDRLALQKNLDRLTQENADLRRELDELRRMVDGSLGKPKPEAGLPNEEQVDKAFSTIDRILDKLRKLARKYGTDPDSEPNKPL